MNGLFELVPDVARLNAHQSQYILGLFQILYILSVGS